MNKFMYLSKRRISNDIKSLYPKCINCINFKREERSCKKIVSSGNYVDYNLTNELADNVRADNTKCGESGKLFDIGKEKLEKDNIEIFKVFCCFSLSTGFLSLATTELIVIIIPVCLSFSTFLLYSIDYYDYQTKIDNEKKRLENLKQFQNK
jgi:hypothetical protein